jgi:hypothetical protein
MRAKISMMPVNMTGYLVVRKTAQHAPALAELEFAMHTKEALVKYDEALKYASNWKQLKEAREAAAKQKS